VDLKKCIGLGIAGNFADHLEQAKESADFINVKVDEKDAPKGIFPFYLPDSKSFLGQYPLSSQKLVLPQYKANVHMEPELALLCKISYDESSILDIAPLKFAAFNDCTIRKDGAKKISEKKNWGESSKGVSTDFIDIDKFENGGVLDSYRIASFLRRGDRFEPYGINSPVLGYSYFYKKLKKWIIDKLNNQKDSNPLENINQYIKELEKPNYALISIGATAYTEFGENGFLHSGDEIYVCIYDSRIYSQELISSIIKSDDTSKKDGLSLLYQKVE